MYARPDRYTSSRLALIPGTRLGVYEITAKIGEGGMGQVYRGTDTILGRQVAIKVLPEAFAADTERVARFDREAKTLASLNHPNIAAIYSVEQSAGSQALVMEFVEGDDLSRRIAQGAIPLDEALSIAKQIAEALAAAHERGIIHRDLKPANIKLRPDGVVKVLDLGLAKAIIDDGSWESTDPATHTAIGTRAGTIIGTAAYMSPEQARGRPIDKRTDVWAFGCVLYEMLAGKSAFGRDTLSDTLAAVLSSDPDWTTLGPDVPAPVRLLLQQCLDKDRKRRISDISTALFAMSDPRMAAPTSAATPPVDRTRRLRVWPLVAAVGATALVVGAGSAAWFQSRSVPGRVTRFTVGPVGPTALNVASGADVAISPDGSQIVYTGNQGAQLFRRAFDALEPVALTGWDHPRMPFFSPDGQWVGFLAQFLLKKVPITGGPSVTLLALGARNIAGATWGENGIIIFATSDASTGLEQIADSGGAATVLTRPDREQGETDHLWPVFLPGGQAVLFTITRRGRADDATVAVLDLRTRKYKPLVQGGSHARYVPSGHLVYGAAGTLRVVAFDLDRLVVVGTPVPVLPQLVMTAQGAADFDVASDGTLVYVPTGLASATRTLVWVDRQGGEEPIGTPPRAYQYVRLSPDGRRVALDVRDQEDDIWIWEIADGKLTRLTIDPARDRFPVWTPDGHILFVSERTGPANVFSQASDGTGVAVQLTHNTADDHVPTSVSPDGAWAVIRTGAPQSFDLSMVSLLKDHPVQVLLNTPASEQNGEISPDGRWLAYQSNESKSGQFEIYVRPFPNVNGGFWQVSTEGGTQPLWATGGGELFYRSLTGEVMSVKVNPGAGWSASAPAKLFDGGVYAFGAGEAFGRAYDYDGTRKRFLMVRTPESPKSSAPPPGFVVVQNWFEELKRLAPTK